MGAACGIAGSREPEVEGIFLCRGESEAAWFVHMNNTGGPVDVWVVTGVGRTELHDNGSGLWYSQERSRPPRSTLRAGLLQTHLSDAHHAEAGSDRPLADLNESAGLPVSRSPDGPWPR